VGVSNAVRKTAKRTAKKQEWYTLLMENWRPYRTSLASLLMWLGALPLWAFLIVVIGNSPGFGRLGFIITPIALVAATAAIFRLLRDRRNGLATAALLAGIILTGALMVVAAISQFSNQLYAGFKTPYATMRAS
jgi:hypothetical protein